MNGKVRLGSLLVLLASLATVLPAQAPADPGMVLVSVSVLGPGDKPVPNLKREDFRLLEDDMEQTISLFREDTAGNQYTIGYNSRNSVRDGRWRRVRVVSAGSYRVRHSSGYYAPAK